MNEDIAKFVYDSMRQRTKKKTKIMKSTSLRAFTPSCFQNYATKPEISQNRHASFRSNQNSMYLHLTFNIVAALCILYFMALK